MTSESQQKILKVVNRVFAEVGDALGSGPYNYDEGISLVCEFGRKSVFALLLDLARKFLPCEGDGSLRPDNIETYLLAMDTKEKAEAVLLAIPEPDPHTLNAILEAVNSALPNLRQILLPVAKRLPHAPGGRPKKLAEPLKRQAIRREIGSLLAKGVSLRDSQKRLALREGAGLSTIQKIWRERKKVVVDVPAE